MGNPTTGAIITAVSQGLHYLEARVRSQEGVKQDTLKWDTGVFFYIFYYNFKMLITKVRGLQTPSPMSTHSSSHEPLVGKGEGSEGKVPTFPHVCAGLWGCKGRGCAAPCHQTTLVLRDRDGLLVPPRAFGEEEECPRGVTWMVDG